MTAVKRHRLSLEAHYDFDLIGICSAHADYRLCWEVNRALGTALKKGADLSILKSNGREHVHSFYECEEENASYYLVKNASHQRQPLIPEKNQIDYFLVIKGDHSVSTAAVVRQLRAVEGVLTALSYAPQTLKSKANLIF